MIRCVIFRVEHISMLALIPSATTSSSIIAPGRRVIHLIWHASIIIVVSVAGAGDAQVRVVEHGLHTLPQLVQHVDDHEHFHDEAGEWGVGVIHRRIKIGLLAQNLDAIIVSAAHAADVTVAIIQDPEEE